MQKKICIVQACIPLPSDRMFIDSLSIVIWGGACQYYSNMDDLSVRQYNALGWGQSGGDNLAGQVDEQEKVLEPFEAEYYRELPSVTATQLRDKLQIRKEGGRRPTNQFHIEINNNVCCKDWGNRPSLSIHCANHLARNSSTLLTNHRVLLNILSNICKWTLKESIALGKVIPSCL